MNCFDLKLFTFFEYFFQVELESMAMKAEQITEENHNLHSELRKATELQIQSTPRSQLHPPCSPHVVAMKNVEDLKERLQAASSEREAFRSLLKKTSASLEAAQKNEQVSVVNSLRHSHYLYPCNQMFHYNKQDKDFQLKDCKAELEQAQQAAVSLSQPLAEMQTTLSNVSEVDPTFF